MESPVMFFLILVTITFVSDPAYSQKIYASQNPLPVGSTVTFSSEASVSTGAWLFNNDIIVIIFPGNVIIANKWSTRVTFNSTTSSLTIRSIQQEDSGLYTLQSVNSFRAQLTLSVQVPISNVTLKANATNLVEFNSTAVLMCSLSNGSSLTYFWLKGNSMVTAGGDVQLSNGGATLTIVRVTRYDEGPFRCNVSNGISNEISLPVYLNISYGPSNVTMMTIPMSDSYRTGSNITLSCSAKSSPPAMIQWMVNGVYLNKFGPQLQLERVTEDNSGNYQCLFHNTVTMRFSSASTMIRILEPISAVVVNHTGGPAILHELFMLHCEVTGSVDSIKWWRNGELITADNTTVFDMGNRTLLLHPIQLSDNGEYKCQASNAVSIMTSSPYTVEVNYGPMKPVISGPSVALTGSHETLSCSSASHPPSHISWYFNNFLVATTSKLMMGPLTLNMSGKYICMAFNNITGKNSTAYITLTVVDPITDVRVATAMNPAIEGHFYKLTCNVTGPADHVYWMKNGQPLHENNIIYSYMDNKTLVFQTVQYNDTGKYQCMAVNAVSNMTSLPYILLVNFGPDTPIIDGPTLASTESKVVFNCSAKSLPPSQFSWWFNGSKVASTSVFMISNVSLNMSGEYTCMAYNYVTEKNSTKSQMLKVIEAIQSVMIISNTVPINSENFSLTCKVTGPYDTIYWMKNNMNLTMNTSTANQNVSYHTKNSMLYFTPVTIHNDGTYQCVATNHGLQFKSPQYTLLVNYGPLNVTITGPDSENIGSTVSLTCSADSRPDCDFYWFLNHSSMVLKTGSVLTFPVTNESDGDYTCKARNPVTNITMYQTKTFTAHATALHIPSQGLLMLMGLFALSVTVLFN